MGRTATNARGKRQPSARRARSTRVTETKEKTAGQEVIDTDALLLAAIKASMSEEEIAEFVRDQQLENIAKVSYANLMEGIKTLSLGEEYEGKAIILLPCEPWIDHADPADIVSEEDEEDGEDGDDYDTRSIIKDLRAYIKAEEVTQGWIAEQCEVSQACVSTWIAGTSEPRQKNCASLASFLYE